MEKDVLITISDRHDASDSNEVSELMTVGHFSGDDENYSLVYTERDEELKSSITTVRVEGQQKIMMIRTGVYAAEMIMEKNKRHSCHYETPYGGFIMGVYASNIDSCVDGGSGSLTFKYTLDFNSSNTTENELRFSFKDVAEQ